MQPRVQEPAGRPPTRARTRSSGARSALVTATSRRFIGIAFEAWCARLHAEQEDEPAAGIQRSAGEIYCRETQTLVEDNRMRPSYDCRCSDARNGSRVTATRCGGTSDPRTRRQRRTGPLPYSTRPEIRFAILKAQQGNDGFDPWFGRNMRAALANRLVPFAYCFAYPLPPQNPGSVIAGGIPGRDPRGAGELCVTRVHAYPEMVGRPLFLDLEWPPPDDWAKWGCGASPSASGAASSALRWRASLA